MRAMVRGDGARDFVPEAPAHRRQTAERLVHVPENARDDAGGDRHFTAQLMTQSADSIEHNQLAGVVQ